MPAIGIAITITIITITMSLATVFGRCLPLMHALCHLFFIFFSLRFLVLRYFLIFLSRDGYFLFLVDACLLCTVSAILRKDRDKPANDDDEKEDIRDDDDHDDDYDDATSTSV